MGNRHGFGLWAVALTVVGFVAAPAAAGVTVGDFLREVAIAKRLPATDATVAEASLRAAGFSLPTLARSARLTKGAVAAISTAVGLHVTTGDPGADFDQRSLDRFMAAVAPQLQRARGGALDPRAAGTDSGSSSGKGRPRSKSPKKPKHPRPPT